MGLIHPKTANSADTSGFVKLNWSLTLIYQWCMVDTDYSGSFHPFLGVEYPISGLSGGVSGSITGLIWPKTTNLAYKSSFVRPNLSANIFIIDRSPRLYPFLFETIKYPNGGRGLSGSKVGPSWSKMLNFDDNPLFYLTASEFKFSSTLYDR